MKRRAWMGTMAALAGGEALAGPRSAEAADAQRHPDVLEVRVHDRGGDRFDFDVTLSSPYDTPQRYADAFRVLGPDGTELGLRTLWHDHASEQPFTRDLHGLSIPPGVRKVSVQGRDRLHGWGGRTIEVSLPGR